MGLISSLLEAVGLAAVVAGAALFDWRAGLIVAGVVAVFVGYILDGPRRVG